MISQPYVVFLTVMGLLAFVAWLLQRVRIQTLDRNGIIHGDAADTIRKEIRDGTPNTPNRRATLARADTVFASTRRHWVLLDLKAWLVGLNHDKVDEAWQDMLTDSHLAAWGAATIRPQFLLQFIETLAERTL